MLPFPFCLLLRSQIKRKKTGRDKGNSIDFGPDQQEPKYQLFHLDVTYPLWDSFLIYSSIYSIVIFEYTVCARLCSGYLGCIREQNRPQIELGGGGLIF